jgi:hypothetical protein
MNKKLFAISVGSFLVVALVVGFGSFKQASADNGSEQGNTSGNNGNGIGQVVKTLATSIGENQSSANLTGGTSQDITQSESSGGTQESAQLNASGNFTITGVTVVSVDATGNSITGTLYGITKTMSTAGATITGGNTVIALMSIQPGDIVSATGNYNASTHTATLSTINDLSYAQQNTANVQSRINQLLQLVQQLQAQLQAMQSKS